jgi:small conductance mechanosensitive channel
MPEFTSAMAEDLIAFGLHLLYAIAFVIIGLNAARWLSGRIRRMKLMQRIDPNAASFIGSSSLLVLRVVVLVIAALIIGVPGSAFITLFGSAGVAIGLALQGSLSNLAGGLMLLFFRPFSVGDYIKTGSDEGTVKQISAFYTTILTLDNRRVILPNGELTNSRLINYSAEPTRMVDLAFSVAYDSDAEHVRAVLLRCAAENPHVLSEPEPVVLMTGHGESAVTFNLRAWVAKENYGAARFGLIEAAKAAFDRENICIPYPQMDIHMKT